LKLKFHEKLTRNQNFMKNLLPTNDLKNEKFTSKTKITKKMTFLKSSGTP